MKLRATIVEETSPQKNIMIVRFEGDKKNQHFEVKCTYNPHMHRLRKWDIVLIWIKWETEIFTDPKTKEKSYFTHLVSDKVMDLTTRYR